MYGDEITFDEWFAGQAHWLSNEKVCRGIWNAATQLQQDEIAELRAQVANLSLYKPARRTEQKQEPVKAIGQLNEAFWFGLEAAEKDFNSFGKPYQEVAG